MSAHTFDAWDSRPMRDHVREVAQLPEAEPRISTRALLWSLAVLQVLAAVAQVIGMSLLQPWTL